MGSVTPTMSNEQLRTLRWKERTLHLLSLGTVAGFFLLGFIHPA